MMIYQYHLSNHAKRQARRRGISMAMVKLAILYGDEYYAGKGSHAFLLSNRSIKTALKRGHLNPRQAQALIEAARCCIVATNELIVTIMHTQKPPKFWRAS